MLLCRTEQVAPLIESLLQMSLSRELMRIMSIISNHTVANYPYNVHFMIIYGLF